MRDPPQSAAPPTPQRLYPSSAARLPPEEREAVCCRACARRRRPNRLWYAVQSRTIPPGARDQGSREVRPDMATGVYGAQRGADVVYSWMDMRPRAYVHECLRYR